MSNREALKKNRDSLTQENVCSSLHVLPTHTEAEKFPSLICQCRDLNYDCDEVCHISKLIVFKRGVAIFKSATSLRSVYQIHRSKALPSFKYFLVEHCTVMIFISISQQHSSGFTCHSSWASSLAVWCCGFFSLKASFKFAPCGLGKSMELEMKPRLKCVTRTTTFPF